MEERRDGGDGGRECGDGGRECVASANASVDRCLSLV